MKNLKKFLFFCLICVLLVGCSSAEEERSSKKKDKEIRHNKIDNEEEKVVDSDLSISEPDNDAYDNQMSLEEKIYNYDGAINVDGEMCQAIWGKSLGLVWKSVGATFEDDAHFLYAMVQDISGDAYRCTEWASLYYYENFDFFHVGDDMFAMKFTHSCYIDWYVGFKERERYIYINGTDRMIFSDVNKLADERDYFDRITEFNDGYAICQYKKYSAVNLDSTYISVMDKKGNITISDMLVPDYINTVDVVQCGCYSDGLFYYDYAFYDIAFNKIVDLSGKGMGRPYVNHGLYTPQYVNGICTMVTEKNGLYWIFDIDMNGEIISEVEEFDIWSLNI